MQRTARRARELTEIERSTIELGHAPGRCAQVKERGKGARYGGSEKAFKKWLSGGQNKKS